MKPVVSEQVLSDAEFVKTVGKYKGACQDLKKHRQKVTQCNKKVKAMYANMQRFVEKHGEVVASGLCGQNIVLEKKTAKKAITKDNVASTLKSQLNIGHADLDKCLSKLDEDRETVQKTKLVIN